MEMSQQPGQWSRVLKDAMLFNYGVVSYNYILFFKYKLRNDMDTFQSKDHSTKVTGQGCLKILLHTLM